MCVSKFVCLKEKNEPPFITIIYLFRVTIKKTDSIVIKTKTLTSSYSIDFTDTEIEDVSENIVGTIHVSCDESGKKLEFSTKFNIYEGVCWKYIHLFNKFNHKN